MTPKPKPGGTWRLIGIMLRGHNRADLWCPPPNLYLYRLRTIHHDGAHYIYYQRIA